MAISVFMNLHIFSHRKEVDEEKRNQQDFYCSARAMWQQATVRHREWRERESLKTIEKACTYTSRTSTKETVLHFILLILLTQTYGKEKENQGKSEIRSDQIRAVLHIHIISVLLFDFHPENVKPRENMLTYHILFSIVGFLMNPIF